MNIWLHLQSSASQLFCLVVSHVMCYVFLVPYGKLDGFDHFLPRGEVMHSDGRAALRLLRHLCGARETNSRRRRSRHSFLRLFLLSKRSSRVTCSFVGFLTAYCRLLPSLRTPRHTRSLRCVPPVRVSPRNNFKFHAVARSKKQTRRVDNERTDGEGRHNERASLHPSARRLSPNSASWGRMAK